MRKQATNPLTELVRLIKVAEEGSNEIGAFFRLHVAELAVILNVPESVLLSSALEPDDILARKVAGTLRRNKELEAQSKTVACQVAVEEAARQLAVSATWKSDAVYLDILLLLGNLLVDASKKYIAFDLEPDKSVSIERDALVAASKGLRNKRDLFAYVDQRGIHLRWAGGRGGINWYPQSVLPTEKHLVLHVDLIRQPVPILVQPTTRKGGRWTWDAFAEAAAAI